MITKYQTGDAALVLPQPMQADEAKEFADFFDTIEAYSLIDEKTGAVAAVFGFRLCDEMSAEGFALLSAISIRLLKQLVQFLKIFIRQKMIETNVKILRATVKKNFAGGYKFLYLLGFKHVAVLPDFYDGEDYQLFERRIK